ncbi:MAG: hypothetical protein ABI821_12810 [Pseudomonadota bacterium]
MPHNREYCLFLVDGKLLARAPTPEAVNVNSSGKGSDLQSHPDRLPLTRATFDFAPTQ